MRPSVVAATAFLVLFFVGESSLALGDTICGTVRDAQPGAPIADAGVFVRTISGDYTGFSGATDLAGHFCVPDIPAAGGNGGRCSSPFFLIHRHRAVVQRRQICREIFRPMSCV
jgi:hypothetical protein